MKLPLRLTIGETYGPAMEITDQAEADEYFKALVERQALVSGITEERAAEIERANLSYYSGYYSDKTTVRVNRLFKVAGKGGGG